MLQANLEREPCPKVQLHCRTWSRLCRVRHLTRTGWETLFVGSFFHAVIQHLFKHLGTFRAPSVMSRKLLIVNNEDNITHLMHRAHIVQCVFHIALSLFGPWISSSLFPPWFHGDKVSVDLLRKDKTRRSLPLLPVELKRINRCKSVVAKAVAPSASFLDSGQIWL